MKKLIKLVAVLLGLMLLALSWPAWQLYTEIQKARSEDPLVWEDDIRALEASTAGIYPPGEAVVFVGSSSIRLWDTLAEDMSGLAPVQHGFGGAKLQDVVFYAERLVNAYQPRAVVVFAGTNDIHPGASKLPQVLLASYQALVHTIRAGQPDVDIFYIGITPSPMRWAVWPIAQETNQLIQDWSVRGAHLHFIDTSEGLMGANGEPDAEKYRFDGLHLNTQGYTAWSEIIRARLTSVLGESNGITRR